MATMVGRVGGPDGDEAIPASEKSTISRVQPLDFSAWLVYHINEAGLDPLILKHRGLTAL